MKSSFLKLGLGAALLLAAAAAQAQANMVKLGVTRYTTHSETGGLTITPPAAGAALSGSDVETGDATTLVFMYERRLTPNIDLELVLGIPPRVDSTASGPLASVLQQAGLSTNVLSAKNVSPALIANYYFFDESAKLRPYLGAGINYTRFIGIESSIPGAVVDMSDSWGWALQAGLSYAVSREWGLFASATRLDVSSDVTAKATLPVGASLVPVTVTTTIDLKPVTYQAGVWFAF